MFIISNVLMINLLSNLLMIVGGVCCILYFGGFIVPKHRSEAQREKFEDYKKRRGKLVIFTGGLLILLGGFKMLFLLGLF
jgi:hypothetical protein